MLETSERMKNWQTDWRRREDERKTRLEAWIAANPEVARDWDEAAPMNEKITAEREEADRLARLDERMPRQLASSGCPARCVDAWRAGPALTPAIEAVRSPEAKAKGFLLLVGGVGTGKTLAGVVAIADGLLRERTPGVKPRAGCFVRAAELARRGLYGEEAEMYARFHMEIPILVIDDLGAELLSDPWRAGLDELLDVRYGNKLRTILTTNLDAASFRERYGERIADRIRHDGLIASSGSTSLRVPVRPG